MRGPEGQDHDRPGVLRILILDDSSLDAQLVGARLSEGGIGCELVRVQSRDAFAAALEEGGVDLILADYAPPGFDGLSALRLAKELRPGVPFIFISGTLGEEVAIETLKSGATDYVLKHRLERLLPAVRRAMREAEERRERERAQEELTRLASFPRLSPTLIVETVVDGEPTFINPAAQERFPDLVESGWHHPILADLTSVDRELRVSGGQSVTSEVWVDDVLYQRRILAVPGSDILRVYATDITERRQAEEALKRSEERFRSLVRYASDIIVILDAEGIILYESPVVERVLGFRSKERIGTDAFSHIHPDDLETVRSRFAELLEDPDLRLSVEYRTRDSNGIWRHFEAIGTNLLDDPVIRGIVINTRDISEHKRAEKALRDSERALQNLVEKLLGAQEEERRRVAYEVHDGLAQVAVAAHQNLQAFARRYAPQAGRGRRELDRILGQVRTTVSDARRVIANLRPTALDDLGLAAAISLEVERMNEEGYQVDLEEHLGDERLPKEMEIALFRVAQEALTNIRKHAQTKWLKIELRRDAEIYLEVRDFGRGFDPAALETLGGGPGERVGLAGMRERVGMLGGELEIQSRPKAGTSITATIPLRRTPLRDNRGGRTSL